MVLTCINTHRRVSLTLLNFVNFPHIKFSFVFHQERLLHRNSDFHATEDNRGITQRAKRSPGKQPETGTGLLHLSLFSSHLDTDVVCWVSKFKFLPFIFFRLKLQIKILLKNFKKHKHMFIALWCTCVSVFFGYVIGNSLVNCWATLSLTPCLFGGDLVQCK